MNEGKSIFFKIGQILVIADNLMTGFEETYSNAKLARKCVLQTKFRLKFDLKMRQILFSLNQIADKASFTTQKINVS